MFKLVVQQESGHTAALVASCLPNCARSRDMNMSDSGMCAQLFDEERCGHVDM
jgi:hypothetical protein